MLNSEINKKTQSGDLTKEEILEIYNSLKSVFDGLIKKDFHPMIVNNKKEIEQLQRENPDKKFKPKEDVISLNLKII